MISFHVYKNDFDCVRKLKLSPVLDRFQVRRNTVYLFYFHKFKTTPCPRKNYNTVYVAITLAKTSDFNEILHQHCEVKLQTSHQILAEFNQHLQQLQQV